MNKIIFSFFLSTSAYYFSYAQNDEQVSISTEEGIFTVSKTSGGKDMIFFNTTLWDDIMQGTKYISQNLPVSTTIHVCIELANKKQLHCKGGIGFRCGIYDCNCYSNSKPVHINNNNRVCSTLIQKIDRQTIRMIFCDKVDWQDLQCKNQTGTP